MAARIQDIPAETLSEVFQHLVNGNRAQYEEAFPGHWLVGFTQVCRLWRAIAHSLPQLWTNLDLDLSTNNALLLAKVQFYLQKSGTRPLYVTIRGPDSLRSHLMDDLGDLWRVLFPSAERWFGLSLLQLRDERTRTTRETRPPLLWINLPESLPLLEELALEMEPLGGYPTMSHLRVLHLESRFVDYQVPRIQSSIVTELSIELFSRTWSRLYLGGRADLLDLLTGLPGLQSLNLLAPMSIYADAEPTPSSLPYIRNMQLHPKNAFALKHNIDTPLFSQLESLITLPTSDEIEALRLVKCLRGVPNLRHLHLRIDIPLWSHEEPSARSFAGLRFLTSLVVEGRSASGVLTIALSNEGFPNIEHLEVVSSDMQGQVLLSFAEARKATLRRVIAKNCEFVTEEDIGTIQRLLGSRA